MTITLDTIMRALDRFPHLTQDQRALIFDAIDLAPTDLPPDPSVFAKPAAEQTQAEIDAEAAAHEWYEAYYDSRAAWAWNRVKYIYMTPVDPAHPRPYHLTLDEACGYESCPTGLEIMKALDRAERLVNQ